MTKENLIRAKAFTKSYSESISSNIRPNTGLTPGKHVAIARSIYSPKNVYRGIEGSLNIYNPSVQGTDMASGSHLWIERGEPNVRNSIQVGWTVNPSLNHDTKTRSFVYWRVNERDMGCFNTLCSGFIQTSSDFQLDGPLHSSNYGDITQWEENYRIFQDRVTGAWWFDIPSDNITVGYWPPELFTTLGNGQGAYHVTWGGMVMGQSNGPSPQMGSGHFPDGRYRHGCYVKNMHIIVDDNYMIPPAPPKYQIEMNGDDPKCYGVQGYGYNGARHGFSFLFGGPGGDRCGP